MSTISDAEFAAYFYDDKTKDKARKIMAKMGVNSKEYMEVIDNMNVIERPTLNKTLIYTTLVFALLFLVISFIKLQYQVTIMHAPTEVSAKAMTEEMKNLVYISITWLVPTFILVCVSIDHLRKHKNKLKSRYIEKVELDVTKKQLQEKLEKKWKEIKTKKYKSS